MTGFHEVRFPADISALAKGGPRFMTNIVTLANGHEKRNISWEKARSSYQLNYSDISKVQNTKLFSFFLARMGRAYGFRFKDWNDFEAKEQKLGIGDGEKTKFQLIKNYGEGIQFYQRHITKPVEGKLLLYLDDVLQSANFSLAYDDGSITFTSPVPEGVEIKASFEFDVPVRFNTDSLWSETESFTKNSIQKIELIEIKG